MSNRHLPVLIAFVIAGATTSSLVAAPVVRFELVMGRGFSPADSQQWVQFLAKLDQTSIRIRQGNGGERPSINEEGTADRPAYFVVGILTGRNQLQLPGGTYSLSDRERLRQWLDQLGAEGIVDPADKPVGFGLSADQLVAFHDKLAGAYTGESKGRRAGDVAREIVRGLSIEFVVTDGARESFGSPDLCPDPLTGLSAGTALAAVIRPLGLVCRPEKAGQTVRLKICAVRETEEAWPVGWPSEQTPGETAPKLFDFLNADIQNVSLGKTLDALQAKVGIPFLIDHNGLARQRIDLATTKVTYPKGRAMYQKVLSKILFQSRLKSELRVDEAGHPFVWIAPQ